MKTDQSKTPNYGHSNVELITQKDSVSYVVGLKYSEQFHGQEVFKSLDKELISQGFSDEIGSYDINKCFSDVEAYLASESMRNNKSFTDSCSRSFGRFSIYNFTESLAQLAALEMLNINSICLGFSDGIRQKNVFRENIEIESRIYYEFQKEVFDDIKFLKRNKTKKGIIETKSGIQYKILRKGKGPNPTENSRVKVHYRGSILSGEEFDSSFKRGEASEFRLNQVIPGWTEGIQLMRPGAQFIFYIPQELAYGANPPGNVIKPYSLLIFEVELLEIL